MHRIRQMFPNLKKSLAGKQFSSNIGVVKTVDGYFENLVKYYFSDGMKVI